MATHGSDPDVTATPVNWAVLRLVAPCTVSRAESPVVPITATLYPSGSLKISGTPAANRNDVARAAVGSVPISMEHAVSVGVATIPEARAQELRRAALVPEGWHDEEGRGAGPS